MKNKAVVAILDNIRSRENVGSIFRTADAAGVSKIYLCGITPQPPHPKISKTSLGADLMVQWEYHKQAWRLVEQLRSEGYKLVALEKNKNSQNLFSQKANYDPMALIVGNEVSGISTSILKRSDLVISIPMRGQKESLNVAVAFGVAIYTLLKK